MSVPNQTDHREAYREQLAAGKVAVSPKPGQPFVAVLAPPKRRAPRPNEKLTLGQRLGLHDMPAEWPKDEPGTVAPALPAMAPPTPVKATTAEEVSTEPVDDVEVDPPQCDDEIADVPDTPSTLESFDLGQHAAQPTEKRLI